MAILEPANRLLRSNTDVMFDVCVIIILSANKLRAFHTREKWKMSCFPENVFDDAYTSSLPG